MISLKTEYIDTKDIKHLVEHIIISDGDSSNKERIAEELFHALTRIVKVHVSTVN